MALRLQLPDICPTFAEAIVLQEFVDTEEQLYLELQDRGHCGSMDGRGCWCSRVLRRRCQC